MVASTSRMLFFAAASAAATFVARPAHAFDYYWNVASGNWASASNWSPNGFPGASDNAHLNFHNAAVTVNSSVGTISTVYVANGTNLQVNNEAIANGFLGISGTLVVGTVADTDTGLEAGAVNVSSAGRFSPFAGQINAASLELGGEGFGTFTQSAGTVTVGAATIGAPGFPAFGRYSLSGGVLNCTNTRFIGNATFTYSGGALSLGSLSIGGGSQIILTSGGTKLLRTTHVDIDNSGTLNGGIDLADNAMIVDYSGPSPITTVRSYIVNASYDAFNQVAHGIVSSAAILSIGSAHPLVLGLADASALGVGSFQGQSVDSTALLLRCTYAGDANLDGTVNALDFNAVASNYGGTGKFYTQGDFNYDGAVTSVDFTAMAQNFGQTMSSAALAALVPEPTALAVLALLLPALRFRRREHHPMLYPPRFCG